MKERREESNQRAKQQGSGGPSGQEGGLSARATRTVHQGTADRPHGYVEPSSLSRRLSVKANRTSSSEPRKTDRPRGARGLSARHPRTVRAAVADCPKPLPTKARNQNRSKAKPSKNTKNMRRTQHPRTVRQPHADCLRLTDKARTARPRRSTPPTHHRMSQMVEAVETRV
jgi:hypothetical protein